MSYSQKVTTKAGTVKTVIADSEAELRDAVSAVENEKAPVTVDINVPVRKGHDLLQVEEDGVTQGLTDGRGAHNSPRPAIRDDGSVEGQPEVPVVVQSRNLNTSDTTAENLKKVDSDGELSDYTAEDAAKAEEASVPAAAPADVVPAPAEKTSKKSSK